MVTLHGLMASITEFIFVAPSSLPAVTLSGYIFSQLKKLLWSWGGRERGPVVIWNSTATQKLGLAEEGTVVSEWVLVWRSCQLKERVELQPASGILWHLNPTNIQVDRALPPILSLPTKHFCSFLCISTNTHISVQEPTQGSNLSGS